MALKPYLRLGQANASQGSQQVFHRGHGLRAKVEGGAELAVSHLIRTQLDRFSRPWQTHVKAGLIGGMQSHPRFTAAVKTNPSSLRIRRQRPRGCVVLRPMGH